MYISSTEREHSIRHDKLNAAFNDGSSVDLSDEEIVASLNALCTLNIRSDEVRVKSINRAITLNAILTERFMRRVDAATTRNTRVVILLTIIATLAAGAQVLIGLLQLCNGS